MFKIIFTPNYHFLNVSLEGDHFNCLEMSSPGWYLKKLTYGRVTIVVATSFIALQQTLNTFFLVMLLQG